MPQDPTGRLQRVVACRAQGHSYILHTVDKESTIEAWLICVPKVSLENSGPVMSARPSGFRPIALSNTAQKIIASYTPRAGDARRRGGIMAAPMHALQPVLVARFAALDAHAAPPDLATTCRAAQVRTGLTHARSRFYLERTSGIMDGGDTLLRWRRVNPLGIGRGGRLRQRLG